MSELSFEQMLDESFKTNQQWRGRRGNCNRCKAR